MRQKISVIIPIFNEEKWVGKCLDSLIPQTLPSDEIIIVDDGSTDKSLDSVKRLASRVKNMKILQQRHQGPGTARNLGAKTASGEILVFVDADMKFDRCYLEKLTRPIRLGKAKATFTINEYVANSNNIWSECWVMNSLLPPIHRIKPSSLKFANNFRAILKSTFSKTKGYLNVGYGEDVTVLKQLKMKSDLAKDAVCYHYNPETLKEVFDSSRWMGRGETVKFGWKTMLTYSFPNSIKNALIGTLKNKQLAFFIFKIVFDYGMIAGLVERRFRGIYAK